MSAGKLLQLLEESGMLDPKLIADLRRQVAESKYKVSAESIAKALVDKGHLTRFQATKFVGQATAEAQEEERQAAAAKADRQRDEPAPSKDEEDELTLAPEDAAELGLAPDPDESPKSEIESSGDDFVLLEEASDASPAEGLVPVEDAGAALTPVDQPALEPLDELPPAPGPADLGAGTLDDASQLDPFAAGSSAASPTLPQRLPRTRGPRWDTMLMYGGGLALMLLILFGVILWYDLTKTPALEMFEAAMEDYRNESYSQAIAKFEDFLEKYPDDENSSEARVRIALGRIRLAVSHDPEDGLKTAKEQIAAIANEPKMSVAREEFTGILPAIPDGFLKQAKATDNTEEAEKLLAKAQEGMDLILDPANIPSSIRLRIDNEIQRLQEDMALVRRAIDQDKELASAIAGIEEAASEDNTVKAYAIYTELLKKYPGLRNDDELLQAIRRVSQREQSLVKVVQETLEPLTDDLPAPATAVALAQRSGGASTRVQGRVAAVLAGGAVFGLDAGTGQVLWRRFVGQGSTFHPVRISSKEDADFLIVDARNQQLLVCHPDSGALTWRLPIGEPFAHPVVAGTHLYVATESGRVLDVDTRTGRSSAHASIPHRLNVGPAVSPNRPRAYQVAEHSNLYVLSTDTLECKDVYYLGHKTGTVTLPPLVLLGHVFVVENAGQNYARLHVLAIQSDDEGPSLKQAQSPIRLNGTVRFPLMPYGRRLLLLTDRGEIRVFDVEINSADEPVKDAASLTARYEQPVIGYALSDASSLWIADNRLSHYRVQVTTKEITRSPDIAHVGDTFIAPLQLFQDVLVSVRRPAGAVGVTVAGAQIDRLRKPIWETRLAVPVSHAGGGDGPDALSAVTATGALYQVDATAIEKGCLDAPQEAISGILGPAAFTAAVPMGDGRVALINPEDVQQIIFYDPASAGRKLSLVKLSLPETSLSGLPIAFQDALLMPLSNGRLLLIDPQTGSPKALPFEPKLAPGEQIEWSRPTVIGEAGDQVVIRDDRRFLYLLGIKPQPQPFLAELKKVRLDVQITSDLAAAGSMLFGIVGGDRTDAIVALKAGDLEMAEQWDLEGGRVTWGPVSVGQNVLVAVNDQQLRCYGSDGKPRWEKPAPLPAPPVGQPWGEGEQLYFASAKGLVWQVHLATGAVSEPVDVGESLMGSPRPVGPRFAIPGRDGVLLLVNLPSGS